MFYFSLVSTPGISPCDEVGTVWNISNRLSYTSKCINLMLWMLKAMETKPVFKKH